MDLDENVVSTIGELKTQLGVLETKISKVMEKHREEGDNFTPELAIDLSLMRAFCLVALFHAMLKTHGAIPQDHHVSKELARVKEYMNKVAKLKKEREGDIEKRKIELNKEAASRFLANV
eukprot:CAMPEP_0119139200 /NCGR_PEP_ID=MMETSP1310-20130426/27073_1 /TAXON_ID=464262 /ORGANISM="Genus nov. species nov., Strain RCC2339" /LENGTH=119 /DNA_ID=CAMNT_0007130465 /DNA_START=78 /DNA_END=434 /DNA_ORIENTATION=-